MNYNIIRLIYHGFYIAPPSKNNKMHGLSLLIEKFFKSVLSGKIYLIGKTKKTNLFFIGSKNQLSSLSRLRKNLFQDSVTYYHYNEVKINDSNSIKFPFWLSYLLGIISFFFFYKTISLISKRFKEVNPSIDYDYYMSHLIGSYLVAILIIKIQKIKNVWMSNDHSILNVSFIYASKQTRTKSIYIQHASVSSRFPPLNFDYAFLDGQVSFELYKKIGIIGTKIALTGNPKLDGYINKFKISTKIQTILICINKVDDPCIYHALIDSLFEIGYSIKLRKHPSLNEVICNESKVVLSKEEIFMDALSGIDLVIAGDSNVHLEATLVNVPCFYLSTSPLFYDYYGFVKNGLVIWSGDNIKECIDALKDIHLVDSVYQRSKPYCFSIGTEFENKSTNKILNLLGLC